MRTLTFNELEFVSGGDGEPIEEVTVTATRIKRRDVETAMVDLFEDFGSWLRGPGFCGVPGFNVPDVFPRSCADHDRDYSEDSEKDREQADQDFLKNMIAEGISNGMTPQAAAALAAIYYAGVRLGGADAYKGKGGG